VPCKYQYTKETEISLPDGEKMIYEHIHCSLKKDNLPNGVLVSEAFNKKYEAQGKVSNPASYCPWDELDDQMSCPLFELD